MANFTEYLKREGIDPSSEKAQFLGAIYGQESGSGSNTKTSNHGAVGGMQIIPSTFKSVADKGWDISNPEHSARAGIRYGSGLFDKYGAERAAVGYYSGDGGVDAYDKGVYYRDKKNPNAPNTRQYAESVLSRMGSGGNGGNGGAGGSDDSFESFMKSKTPKSDDTDDSFEAFTKRKAAVVESTPVNDDDSFEYFAKTYKPKPLTVIDNTKQPKEPTILDTFTGVRDKISTGIGDAIDASKDASIGFGLNSINKGLAGTADAFVNTPENVMKMGVAGISYGLNKAGLISADELPDINVPTNVIRNALTNTGGISTNEAFNPTTPEGRITDLAIQSTTGGAANKGNMLKNMGTAASVGAGIGTAIEAGVDPVTAIVLGSIAPTVVKGSPAAAKGALNVAENIGGAINKQIPYYSDKSANLEAAKRIYRQTDTNLTPQELSTVIENRLTPNSSIKTGEILGDNNLIRTTNKRAYGVDSGELSKPVDNFANSHPAVTSGVVGGVVGSAIGSPLYGVLAGVMGKSFVSETLSKLTAKQNVKLQAAIDNGLINPAELAKSLKGLKPDKARTTLIDRVNSLTMKNALTGMENDAYTLPAVNKLTQEKEK